MKNTAAVKSITRLIIFNWLAHDLASEMEKKKHFTNQKIAGKINIS